MRYETLNGNKIAFVDSPKEITFEQNHRLNKFLAIDEGIGTTMESIDAHRATIAQLIKAEEPAKALVELENLRMNYYFMLENINPKQEAFYALMYSINGERCTGMNKVKYEKIVGDFKMSHYNILYEVKKKFRRSWTLTSLRMILWRIDITIWLKTKLGHY